MVVHAPPRVTSRLLHDPPTRILAPVGEHDLATQHELRTILGVATGLAAPVVVDMRRTTFADVSIVRAIIEAHAAAEPRSIAVVLPQRGEVVRLFDLTEARALLPVFASLPPAVTWCHLSPG